MRPVIYQLFVRHFSNMNTQGVEWGNIKKNGCGKFNDISEKALREIAKMGFTHVWLTGVLRHATQTDYPSIPAQPKSIVKGIAGSPYAVVDYFDVDPDLAENPENRIGEFKELITRCRRLGLIPLMDFVPNHVSRAYKSECGEDFGAGDDVNTFFASEQGYYYLTTNRDGDGPPVKLPDGIYEGEVSFGRVTGNNCVSWTPGEYDWYETVKLNYGYNFLAGHSALHSLPHWTCSKELAPKTWRIMDSIIAYWQEMGIGGFRCDMAHMIPMAFWRWLISRARVRVSDVFFMAEAYNDDMKTTEGDPCAELLDCGFNAVYDAESYHLSRRIYTEGKWANDFDRLFRNMMFYAKSGVRYLENHDEVRVCSPQCWGGVGEKVLPAIMTLLYASGQGPVLVYNGQEVGERAEGPTGYGGGDGKTSIFDYTCLPQLQAWVANGAYDDAQLSGSAAQLRDFHCRLLPILQNPALDKGEFYGLNWANMQNPSFGREPLEKTSGHWVYAMMRHHAHSKSTVLVIVNLSPDINFFNLKVAVPEHAFGWCGIYSEKVKLENLLYPEEPEKILMKNDLSTIGLSYPLRPGQAAVFQLSAI